MSEDRTCNFRFLLLLLGPSLPLSPPSPSPRRQLPRLLVLLRLPLLLLLRLLRRVDALAGVAAAAAPDNRWSSSLVVRLRDREARS